MHYMDTDPYDESALEELKKVLSLKRVPRRIEGYDISNLGAEETVASMVVFENGHPKKSHYRRFIIKDKKHLQANAPNDFLAMEEVIRRRVKRMDDASNDSFSSLPDLILIDGGKGQLKSALKELKPFLEEGVEVISLAKKNEEIFRKGKKEALVLPRRSEGLRLLQRIRNEAHRFAISHNKQRRNKNITRSSLDEIEGLGKKRKTALLLHFEGLQNLRKASKEEIAKVPGISSTLAEAIHKKLH